MRKYLCLRLQGLKTIATRKNDKSVQPTFSKYEGALPRRGLVQPANVRPLGLLKGSLAVE